MPAYDTKYSTVMSKEVTKREVSLAWAAVQCSPANKTEQGQGHRESSNRSPHGIWYN